MSTTGFPRGLFKPNIDDSEECLPVAPEDWDSEEICCNAPSDFVEQFVAERGRDMYGGDGVDDRRQGRELAHAGLAPWWRP